MSQAALKEQGNQFYKAKKYAEAIDCYGKAIDADSSAPEVHLLYSNRAASYHELANRLVAEAAKEEHLLKSLSDAEECIRLKHEFRKGHSRKVSALHALKRWDDATRAAEAGLQVSQTEEEKKAFNNQMLQIKRSLFCDKIQGRWHGEVTQDLGGYVQEFEFIGEQKLSVTVMGRTVGGSYSLKVEKEPYAMDILVEVPDFDPATMGQAPPAVPYIVRLTGDDTLDICCPYMSPMRPTSFDGPGMCTLKRGKAPDPKVDTELSGLSEEQILLKCAQAVLEILPQEKFAFPQDEDSEQEKAEKVMNQVRFQRAQYDIMQKYTQEKVEKVFYDAEEVASGRKSPGSSPYDKALREISDKLNMFRPDDPQQGQPAPSATKPEASKAAAGTEPAKVTTAQSSENTAQATSTSEEDDDTSLKIILGATIFLGALAAGYAWWRSRRR